MNMYRHILGRGPGLPVGVVVRLEALIGANPVVQEQVLRFIQARYDAPSLIYLPPGVAAAALERPAAFLRAARLFTQPELTL